MKRQTFLKSTLCLLMALVCNVMWAQTSGGFLMGDATTALTDGLYVLVAKCDKGTGPVIYDANAREGKHYRYETGTTLTPGSMVSSKYVWTIDETTVDGVQHITVTNYDDNTKAFPADGAKNQNFTGSGVASLKTEVKTINGKKYIALRLDNDAIGYVHANKPDGNPCLSYWPSYNDADESTGSCIRFTFYPVSGSNEPELESTIYTVDKTTGTLYKDGNKTGQTWNDTWKSTAEPQLEFSCSQNNMQWSDNRIEMMTGSGCTYTVTAPEGYAITAYSFTFANNNHDTGNTLTMIGGSSYTTSRDAQTISAEHSFADGVRRFSFEFRGTNGKGALLTNFTVTVSKPALGDVEEVREEAIEVLEAHASKLGTAVGYYSYTIGGAKVGDAAAVREALNAATTAEEVVEIAESLALNLPEVGKYYRLKGNTSGNYIDAVNCYNGRDQMGMKAADAYSFRGTIFRLEEGNRLKNVGTNTYVYGTRHIGKTNSSDANTWTFSEGSVAGCLILTANGTSSHQLHDNTNRADRCGSICSNGTHNFIVEEVPYYALTVNAAAVAGATGTWNGETKALPATWSLFEGESVASATLTITSHSHALTSVKEGETPISGNTIEINTLTASRTLTAEFSPNIFSATYGEKWVRLQNCSNKSYWATTDGTTGKTATLNYADENQLWCLVGTAESFVLYNKSTGDKKALKVDVNAYGNGSEATIKGDLTATWKLKAQNFGYALVPTQKNNDSEWGINMYGGAGGDLKLYGTGASNTGSYWMVEAVDANPLTLNVEVDKTWESSPRVAELTFTINGAASTTRILGSVEGQALYLPAGATYEVSSMTYRGYTFNGCTDHDGVLTASYTANDERTLYYSRRDGHPYRIPAIATAPNGDVFAICDYRPCNQDIGYGEVDLVCRVSSDNGVTWSEERTIADGLGHINDGIWKMGFGDPAIVADRESNKVLVMSVCGNVTCHNGTYGAAENENPNRVSRLYITYNEDTKEWEYGAPEEVTYSVYPLFKDSEGNVHVASLFIGAGKICQSRVVKKGQYYRLYCAVWAKRNSGDQHHNYVIYSDDFGQSWNLLGSLGYSNSPAPYGNEPKCEELPDGTVVLSSRKGGGRYFNLFTFDDGNYTTGKWGTCVSSNNVTGGLSFGGNDTNGEIYKVKAIHKESGRICDVMLQSVPTGGARDKVAIFYKEMEYKADGTNKYTPETFAQGWTEGKLVSTKGSCYSTMILQADGRLGFFFEEEPSDYCMVYIPYTIEEVTDGAYSLYTVKSSIGEYGVGTFYASEAMQVPEGVTAYVAATAPNNGVLTLTEVKDGIIPAETGALIYGTPKEYEFIPSISYGTAEEDNLLVGYEAADNKSDSYGDVTDYANTYVLTVKEGTPGFYKKDKAFKVYNNKAYLKLPAAAGANALRIQFAGEDATGIEEVELEHQQAAPIYDLQGRRVEKMEKGIYIVNGKKVVIK